MPNKRNAEALEAKLQEVFGGYGLHAMAVKGSDLHLTIGDLARKLASLGVLVPSALTDEQATDFPFDMDFMATGKDGELVEPAAERRAALERIAKGE